MTDAVPAELAVEARLHALAGEDPALAVPSSAVVPPALLVPGAYELRVLATDWLGQTTEHVEGPFTVLPAPPTVALLGVADGAVLRGPVTLTAEAEGWESGPPALTIDGAPWPLGAPYDGEGPHTATIRVTDSFGQEASATVAFVIDATPPVVTVAGVEDSTTLPPGVAATWFVADDTPVQVAATLDGALYEAGTPILALGGHTLEVLAEDAAGNRTVRTGVELLKAGKRLVDAAIEGDCDEPGLAGRITSTLKEAEEILTDLALEQILSRYTGGVIGYKHTETTFDKDCIAAGETACADAGGPEFSFGAGACSFCIRCGSCGPPEEAGPECPVTVPYVDVTAICGGGSVSQTISSPPRTWDPWWWGWDVGGGGTGTTTAPCEP